MTKTADLQPARPHLPSAGAPTAGAASRPTTLNSIWALFAMTLQRQALSRRLMVLALLYTLPIALVVLMRQNNASWNAPGVYQPTFAEFILVFLMIPQAIVPLTALVYSSGMIQDEIEEQTITYLLIRPLPRWSIYAAKLLATLVVTIGLTGAFTALTYVVIGWDQPDYWRDGGLSRLFKTIGLFALTLTAYNSLFGLLSLLMRRAILLGIGYIIFLEGVVANIDFVIRKVTVMYYFRVLCERWLNITEALQVPAQEMSFHIDLENAPSLRACLGTLGIAITVFVALGCYLMGSREFRVKTPEGS